MKKLRENYVEKLISKDRDLKGFIIREFSESLIQAVEEQVKKDSNKSILKVIG